MSSNKSAEMQDFRLNQLEKNIVQVAEKNIVQVVEGDIVKTVASESSVSPADFDFASIVDAVEWLSKAVITQNTITFALEDGIHYTSRDSVTTLDWDNKYFHIDCGLADRVNFEASSIGAATITLNPNVTSFAGRIIHLTGEYVYLRNINIDPLLGGASVIADDINTVLYIKEGYTSCAFQHGTIKNATSGINITRGAFTLSVATVIDCDKGIILEGGAMFGSFQPIFENCTTAINFSTTIGGNLADVSHVDSQYGPIFINCNTEVSIPKNKLTLDNNLYYDGTITKLTGTTAERPTFISADERTYFDTTLGKPIWFDGTNWVDSTGTTV